jgi:hypothetical protein
MAALPAKGGSASQVAKRSADGVSHIIIDTIWEPRLRQVPVPSPSHDFH